MEKFLLNEVKKMEGTLLGIGLVNEKIKTAISKNDKITICNILEENSKRKSKKLKANKTNITVNIKKLRKTFHQKKTDNIICNLEVVEPYLKTFVRDSVYINRGKLYIYGKKEDLEKVKLKYMRYTDDIIINEENVLIVNNKNTKNNWFKDLGYWWKDTLDNLLDMLTLILAN